MTADGTRRARERAFLEDLRELAQRHGAVIRSCHVDGAVGMVSVDASPLRACGVGADRMGRSIQTVVGSPALARRLVLDVCRAAGEIPGLLPWTVCRGGSLGSLRVLCGTGREYEIDMSTDGYSVRYRDEEIARASTVAGALRDAVEAMGGEVER